MWRRSVNVTGWKHDDLHGGEIPFAQMTPAQYRAWVNTLGEPKMQIDTQKVIALIGAAAVAIAFLFVVLAPAFPNVIVPQGTANVVFGLFGIVFGYSAAQFQQNQTTANLMKVQGK